MSTVYNRLPDPDDLILCPYDKAHMVRAKRLPYHLMKCRKNFKGSEFATCPFNARHEMPKVELRFHMDNCPDKHAIEKELAYNQQKDKSEGVWFKGCTDVPSYYKWTPSEPPSENWESEACAEPRVGVDRSTMPNAPYYRNVNGMTPLERRNYYKLLLWKEERRRQGLPSDEEESGGNSENKAAAPALAAPPKPTAPPQLLDAQQLQQTTTARPPHTLPDALNQNHNTFGKVGIGRGRGTCLNLGTTGQVGSDSVVGASSTDWLKDHSRIAANFSLNNTALSRDSHQDNNATLVNSVAQQSWLQSPVSTVNSSAVEALVSAAKGRGRSSPFTTPGGPVAGVDLPQLSSWVPAASLPLCLSGLGSCSPDRFANDCSDAAGDSTSLDTKLERELKKLGKKSKQIAELRKAALGRELNEDEQKKVALEQLIEQEKKDIEKKLHGLRLA